MVFLHYDFQHHHEPVVICSCRTAPGTSLILLCVPWGSDNSLLDLPALAPLMAVGGGLISRLMKIKLSRERDDGVAFVSNQGCHC
jgi:hypothetical protein